MPFQKLSVTLNQIFFKHLLIVFKRPIVIPKHNRRYNPAAIPEGFQRTPLCTGVNWIFAAQYMVPLVKGGRFEYFADAVSDKDR